MSQANILVNLKHNARKAKNQIKKHLKQVDKTRIRPTLDIDDKGRVKRMEARLKKMSRRRTMDIKPVMDKKAMASVKAQQKLLADGGGASSITNKAGRPVDYSSVGGVDGTGRDVGGFKSKELSFEDGVSSKAKSDELSKEIGQVFGKKVDRNLKDQIKTFRRQQRDESGKFGAKPTGQLSSVKRKARQSMGSMGGVDASERSDLFRNPAPTETTKHGPSPLGPFNHGRGIKSGFNENKIKAITQRKADFINRAKEATGSVDKFDISLGQMGDQLKYVGQNFKRFSPNIMMWWKLVAMLLPMVIALAVQFAGVAVAIGAVAVAGAGLMGLGLIGHGEAIADSFGLAERQLNKLKRELFQTFKPALQEFAPISGEFMQKLPQRLAPLVDSLRDLTIFEDSFISLFNNLVGWVGTVTNTLVDYATELDQIAHRFGSILGGGVLNALEWIIQEAYENQDLMIEVMGVFKAVIGSVWNLLKAVSILMAQLKPLFELFHRLMQFLDSKFGMTLLNVGFLLYFVIGLLTSAAKTMLFLHAAASLTGKSMTAQFFSGLLKASAGLKVYIANTLAAIKATYGLAAAIAATGIGALLVGGGMIAGGHLLGKVTNSAEGIEDSRSRTGGYGGSGGTTINNEIHVSGKDATEAARKIEDIDDWHNEEHTRINSQSMG